MISFKQSIPHSLQFKFIRSKLSINTALHYSKLITVHIHKEFPFSFSFVYPTNTTNAEFVPEIHEIIISNSYSRRRRTNFQTLLPFVRKSSRFPVTPIQLRKGGETFELSRESSRKKCESASPLSLPSPLIINGQNLDDCLRIRHAIVRAAIISLRKKTSALLLVYYGF